MGRRTWVLSVLPTPNWGLICDIRRKTYVPYPPLPTHKLRTLPAILPDAGIFWKTAQIHSVKVLFTAPTALRAIAREDPKGELMRKYDLTKLKSLWLAGERSEPGIIRKYQGLLEEIAGPNAIVNDKCVVLYSVLISSQC